MAKPIKIGSDLESFIKEHPEIKIIKAIDGKLQAICIPEEFTVVSLVIINNIIYDFKFIYNEKLYRFEKKETL